MFPSGYVNIIYLLIVSQKTSSGLSCMSYRNRFSINESIGININSWKQDENF